MLPKSAQDKVVYIMRGISGSGKSTLSEQLGQGGEVFSTDDFFMVNGEYMFDRDYLSDAHFWNRSRAIEAMESGVNPIVIDNTHVEAWEAKPYVEAAQANGYRVEIQETQTPWRFDAEELAKRNSHGVPREAIDDMLARWHPNMTVDDIMQSEQPKLSSTRGRRMAGNWYQRVKLADGLFVGQDSSDDVAKQRIINMINGLARSRGISEGEKEGIMNEALSYLSNGYDDHSVINWVKGRMAA